MLLYRKTTVAGRTTATSGSESSLSETHLEIHDGYLGTSTMIDLCQSNARGVPIKPNSQAFENLEARAASLPYHQTTIWQRRQCCRMVELAIAIAIAFLTIHPNFDAVSAP